MKKKALISNILEKEGGGAAGGSTTKVIAFYPVNVVIYIIYMYIEKCRIGR